MPAALTPTEPPACRWALPDPLAAEPGEDIVGIGADLEPGTVLAAYRQGLFPMHLPDGTLAWWSPDPRGILPLDGMRVTRSLRQSAKRFRISTDQAFDDVVAACAERPDAERWINADITAAYAALHRLGWAHSVEVWQDDELVGGLYGVEVGGLFAGESMFHRVRDASKVALLGLVRHLAGAPGERLLDVQWVTDHLASLGAVEIPRGTYLRHLRRAVQSPPAHWTPSR